MIEEKIQIILPIILRNVGPLLLRGGLGGLSGGGGGGTSNNNDDDDFDDDDDNNTSVKTGDDGSKVSVSLPTFPPDTDEDEDDDDASGAGAAAAPVGGSDTDANEDGDSTNSGSPSSDAENNVDSNANAAIKPTSDQPNVSSHAVETQTYVMEPIQTTDSSPTVNSPEAVFNENEQPTTSSQSSDNAIATNKPDTLTGFNNENATPTNVDRNTNLVFSNNTDDIGSESTTFNPDDIHQFIDIRSGFDTSANFSENQTIAPTLSNTPDTPTETEYARNEARRRQAAFQRARH